MTKLSVWLSGTGTLGRALRMGWDTPQDGYGTYNPESKPFARGEHGAFSVD